MSRPHRQFVSAWWQKCGESVTGPKMAECHPYNGRNLTMATSSHARYLPFSSPPRFRGAGVARAVLEAGMGCAVLLVLARLIGTSGEVGRAVAGMLSACAVIWLWAWPAWNLETITGHWYVRLLLGTVRAVLV